MVALKIKLGFANTAVRQQTFDRNAMCGCLCRSVAYRSINFGANTLSTMAANPIDDSGDHGDSHSVQHGNGDTAMGRRNWRNRSGFYQATHPSTCDASSYNHRQHNTDHCAHHNLTNRCPRQNEVLWWKTGRFTFYFTTTYNWVYSD